jgi:hypothetical protein
VAEDATIILEVRWREQTESGFSHDLAVRRTSRGGPLKALDKAAACLEAWASASAALSLLLDAPIDLLRPFLFGQDIHLALPHRKFSNIRSLPTAWNCDNRRVRPSGETESP